MTEWQPTPVEPDEERADERRLEDALRARAEARATAPLDRLVVRLGGELASSTSTSTARGRASAVAPPTTDWVEISALVDDMPVPVAGFSLFHEIAEAEAVDATERALTFKLPVAGDRTLGVTVSPARGEDGSRVYEIEVAAGDDDDAEIKAVPLWSISALLGSRLGSYARLAVWLLATAAVALLLVVVVVPAVRSYLRDRELDRRAADPGHGGSNDLSNAAKNPIAPTVPATNDNRIPIAPAPDTHPDQATIDNRAPKSLGLSETIRDGAALVVVSSDGVFYSGALPENAVDPIQAALRAPQSLTIDAREQPPAPLGPAMGAAAGGHFSIVGPDGRVVREQTPTLAWTQVEGATAIVAVVRDLEDERVVATVRLSGNATSWKVPDLLPRGRVYGWFVHATLGDGVQVRAPVQGRAKFRLLSPEGELLLASFEAAAPAAPLARAIVLYRLGLVDEARLAISDARRANPDSKTVQVLAERIGMPTGR